MVDLKSVPPVEVLCNVDFLHRRFVYYVVYGGRLQPEASTMQYLFYHRDAVILNPDLPPPFRSAAPA